MNFFIGNNGNILKLKSCDSTMFTQIIKEGKLSIIGNKKEKTPSIHIKLWCDLRDSDQLLLYNEGLQTSLDGLFIHRDELFSVILF